MRSRIGYWMMGIALGCCVGPWARAAEPTPRAVLVTVGATVPLQMSSKKLLKTVINEKETVARVSPVAGDPTTVLVTGLAPGITRITLVAVDGDKEVCVLGKRDPRAP